MAGISSLGLGSGLDIRAIVDGLVAAERQPQEFQLARQEANLQGKLSSYGIFKSGLSSFRASLAGLRDAGKFSVLEATSSQSDVINASVSSNADAGQFNLEAKQLAQSQSLVSSGFTAANAIVGTGTLTIKFGTTDYDVDTDTYTGFTQSATQGALTLELDASNNTLAGMREAINDMEAGVSASIIFDGSSHRLVIVSKNTGVANSMEIVASDASLSSFAFNASVSNMVQTQSAQDAILSINGLDVSSASNRFEDTLKGVKIDLAQAKPGQLIKLNISRPTSGVVSAVEAFVEDFNDLVASVNELIRYHPESQTGSILIGDSTLRTSMGQIRSVMSSPGRGGEHSSVKTLVDLGLTTQIDGSIEFDSRQLIAALESDPEGVAAVFNEGLIESLDVVLGGFLDSGGTLQAKTDGLKKSLDLIGDEREQLSDKIANYEARILRRFNAMDALLGQIQGTGDFLTQQLASLPYHRLNNDN